MEPRSNPVLEPPGTQESTRCSTCSPPMFHYRFARQIDSHPYSSMRPCTPLRRFAFPARGRLPQPRGPPAQRATPRPLPRIIHQPQPSPTHNGCGLSVLEWAAAELGYLERPAGKRAEKKKTSPGCFADIGPKTLSTQFHNACSLSQLLCPRGLAPKRLPVQKKGTCRPSLRQIQLAHHSGY